MRSLSAIATGLLARAAIGGVLSKDRLLDGGFIRVNNAISETNAKEDSLIMRDFMVLRIGPLSADSSGVMVCHDDLSLYDESWLEFEVKRSRGSPSWAMVAFNVSDSVVTPITSGFVVDLSDTSSVDEDGYVHLSLDLSSNVKARRGQQAYFGGKEGAASAVCYGLFAIQGGRYINGERTASS